MKKQLKKMYLITVLLLGMSAPIIAQTTSDYCFPFTNTTGCELKVHVNWDIDCNHDGLPDGTGGFLPPFTETTFPAGSSGLLCYGNPPLLCPLIVISATIENTATGEILQLGTGGPGGFGIDYVDFVQFTSGGCTDPIYIVQVIEEKGSRTILSAETPCPPFCFRNETGCWSIEIHITIEGGDDQCKEGFDQDGNGSYLSSSHFIVGNGTVGSEPKEVCTYVYSDFDRKCKICPGAGKVTIWYCGGSVDPCAELGKRGKIKCSDGEEIEVIMTLENGVYVIRKI